jgi:predicted small lipoprotein YifL
MVPCRRPLRLLLLPLAAALLAGCGQKGPLYMPDQQHDSGQRQDQQQLKR